MRRQLSKERPIAGSVEQAEGGNSRINSMYFGGKLISSTKPPLLGATVVCSSFQTGFAFYIAAKQKLTVTLCDFLDCILLTASLAMTTQLVAGVGCTGMWTALPANYTN